MDVAVPGPRSVVGRGRERRRSRRVAIGATVVGCLIGLRGRAGDRHFSEDAERSLKREENGENESRGFHRGNSIRDGWAGHHLYLVPDAPPGVSVRRQPPRR